MVSFTYLFTLNILITGVRICFEICYHVTFMRALASQITGVSMVCSTVFFRRRSKKTSKLRVSGLCGGNSPVTGEFPAQRASDAGNVSIWWRHHGKGNHECVQLIISPRWHYLWHSDETKCHRSWPPLVQLNSPPEPTLTYRQVDSSGLFLGR